MAHSHAKHSLANHLTCIVVLELPIWPAPAVGIIMEKLSKFTNVGHRGAGAYAPGNTIASFDEAMRCQADMIEFDVRQTSDGIMVLNHDSTVKTFAGKRQAVSRLSFSDLVQIMRSRGRVIATFEDVLDRFGPTIPLDIEIKIGGFESQVVRMLRKYSLVYPPILSSFFPWVLRRLKDLDSDLQTAMILGQDSVRRLGALALPVIEKLVTSLGIGSIHLQKSVVTESLIRNLSQIEITVFVWTVDDPDDMRRFIEIGIHGIITNKPDVLYDICLELAGTNRPVLRRIDNHPCRFAYAT
jgi:glycerophosphoryl diester phosphodiesterase